MNYSTNYSMREPVPGEKVKVADINYNTEIIDGVMLDNRQISLEMYRDYETYNENRVVGHENAQGRIRAYRCLEDGTTGAWDDTKWMQTNISDELEDIRESVGASDLGDLGDVEITNPTDGQALLYDPTSSKWHNSDIPDADVTKTASGNPIEITDGADAPLVKCVTEIQGYQDLHGQDKPWVGGAGKNMLNLDGNVYSYSSNTPIGIGSADVVSGQTYTLSCYQDKALTSNTRNTLMIQFDGETYYENTSDNYHLQTGRHSMEFVPASSGTANFYIWCHSPSDSSITYSKIMFQKGTLTDYEPYSNICPITAYTEGEIEVGGHNFYETTNTEAQATSGKVTIISQDSIRVQRNGTSGGRYPASKQLLNVYSLENGKTYRVKAYADITSGMAEIAIRDTSDNPVSASSRITESGLVDVLFTYNPSTDYYLSFFATYDSTVGGDITYSNIEFYEATTHTTTYPSAIYRGSEDCVNGEVSGKKKMLTFNGSEAWTTRSVSVGTLYELPVDVEGLSGSEFAIESISNMYVNDSNLTNSGEFRLLKSSATVAILTIHDDSAGSLANFKTFLSTNNLQLVYTLTNETTEQVTPTNLPIKSLSGYNHIESSAGEMEIEYFPAKEQPLIDLIKSDTVDTQEILYIAPDMNDTEITIDLTAYDEYVFYANDVVISSQIPQGNSFPKVVFTQLTANNSIVIYGFENCSCIYTYANGKLTYSSGRGGYKITMIVGIKRGAETQIITPSQQRSFAKSAPQEEPTEEVKEEPEEVKEDPVEEVKEEETKEEGEVNER